MKRFAQIGAYTGLVLGALVAVPAQALEHKTTIEHPEVGPISADYRGSTVIVEKQVGSVGAAGRPNSLHCRWSVSLTVERTAVADAGMQASRSMTQDDVLKGSAPGWCSSGSKGIQRTVEARRDTLREKMMAMVEQDRAVILVETSGAKKRDSIG
ncbi:hypothetical protein [Novosphingobium sp. AAP83]|uniref:hypothetical protein n=1 Tax=Novosphingobium sp. AAP83 TaxID=1523425 RepID=UPI0006B8FCFA|nr:hypothetical protein [Novosphingobium sp. AAP83]